MPGQTWSSRSDRILCARPLCPTTPCAPRPQADLAAGAPLAGIPLADLRWVLVHSPSALALQVAQGGRADLVLELRLAHACALSLVGGRVAGARAQGSPAASYRACRALATAAPSSATLGLVQCSCLRVVCAGAGPMAGHGRPT